MEDQDKRLFKNAAPESVGEEAGFSLTGPPCSSSNTSDNIKGGKALEFQ